MASETVKQDEYTDAELLEMASFPAMLTDEEMERIESAASDSDWGIARRLVLLALARDAEMLSSLSVESPDAFDEMLGHVEEFRTHVHNLQELADSALLRLRIAGVRTVAA